MINRCNTEYSSPFSVNNQIYFCGVPFRLDTYNGCTFGCKYCYVRAQELTSASRKGRGGHLLIADEADVKRCLVAALDTSIKRADINVEWLRHKVPVHWGGMSDPFQHCEKKYQVSKKWMEYLSWYKYPVIISTKGTILAEPAYLELLKEGNYAVQVSLITDNEEITRQLEPRTPSAQERMKALETLANNGIWTAVRIQPVIPNTVIEYDIPNFIARLAKIGVKHILCEGYKVPFKAVENMNYVWQVCPEAKQEYESLDCNVGGFEIQLPTWRKWKYVKLAIEACHASGMTYGAADNDLRDLGDVVCCCGIDNLPGFENFWKYQASQAAEIAKEKGVVTLEDLKPYAFGKCGFSVHNDLIRFAHKGEFGNIQATPQYAVDFFWERGGANSPECMFSMKRITQEGQVAYKRADPIPVLEKSEAKQERMF